MVFISDGPSDRLSIPIAYKEEGSGPMPLNYLAELGLTAHWRQGQDRTKISHT